tara:strand:- start:3942 stop:4475 length:534 start_codon:yes stop_codon:yes gene_type:complete
MERIEILSKSELKRTISRLASEIIERVEELENCILLGIPTRGVLLAKVLACELSNLIGYEIKMGSLDPTFHRDDLDQCGPRMVKPSHIPGDIQGSKIIIIDDVIYTGRTVRAALNALHSWGRPDQVLLLTMVDRGHREVPIQPDFCGRRVPTRSSESIQLRLQEIDSEEGVFLKKNG